MSQVRLVSSVSGVFCGGFARRGLVWVSLGLSGLFTTVGCEGRVKGSSPGIPDIVVRPGASDASAASERDAAMRPDASSAEPVSPGAGTVVDAATTAGAASSAGSLTVDAGEHTTCGNGILEAGEECDDGNTINNDGCVACFVVPYCGNRIVEATEQCDDGNSVATDGCAGCVVVPLCGNLVVEQDEECDSDAPTCVKCRIVRTPTCGNGRVEFGEQCDTTSSVCVGCQLVVPYCGDGTVQSGEQCDDGNSYDNDGCDRQCRSRRCGDGVVQDGEQCDPPGAFCRADCSLRPPLCGDGTLQTTLGETCDDGNESRGDGCFDCDVECGNGLVEPEIGELCEPGVNTRLCRASIPSVCAPCLAGDCEPRDLCEPRTCTPVPVCEYPVPDDAGLSGDGGIACGDPGPCQDVDNLLTEGAFDEGPGAFQGAERVTISTVAKDGFHSPGALLVSFDNEGTGGTTEARGATRCLVLENRTTYDFQAAYRFPADIWQNSGVSVSLFLYASTACTGSPIAPEASRGPKRSVEHTWTGYSFSVDTSVVNGTAAFGLLVKLDVWRSPELESVDVLWDDVSIVERGAQSTCERDAGVD